MSKYRAILDQLYAADKCLRMARIAINDAIEANGEATALVLAKSLSEITPEKAEEILASLREGDGTLCHDFAPPPDGASKHDDPPSSPVVEDSPRNSNSA